MTLDEALGELRRLNEPVPLPGRLPSETQVRAAEAQANVPFHPDLRRYLLEASNIVYGTLEPLTLGSGHTAFKAVLENARAWGVPDELLPICEDNADFYCINGDGEILFWAHDGLSDESWPNLATWIEEVWIGGA